MEEHLAFEDDGMLHIHILTEVLPNFEDCFMNSHQQLQINNKVLFFLNNNLLIRMKLAKHLALQNFSKTIIKW